VRAFCWDTSLVLPAVCVKIGGVGWADLGGDR
jgi:hypothetical protein